ncbi:hypothetical protein JW766_05115 [Candidatus Dojkabacteria bacterium]|nr:hypothetical protein [Candidatus Dojkabacteria bacterium]
MRGSNSDMFVVPLLKLGEVGIESIGTKAYNLGRLLSLRLPVPNGFVITTSALGQIFSNQKLDELISRELVGVDLSDSIRLENASKKIRSSILKVKIGKDLESEIKRAYASLSGFADAFVAVRSSFPFSDPKKDAFAGQYSAFLNVKGKNDLIEKVKYCWASLYSPQNIFYAANRSLDISSLRIAVVVQKMVQAEASGVMFTLNPIDNDESKIVIECVLGLGEALANGQLSPDNYVVEKETEEILEKKIVPQEWMLVRKGKTKRGEDPNVKVKMGGVWKVRQKLENKYIRKLVKIGKLVEETFGVPQDVEWAYEGGGVWIVQTRPVPTLSIEEDSWKKTPTYSALRAKVESGKSVKEDVVLEQQVVDDGVSSSPKDLRVLINGRVTNGGMVSGVVKIINSPADLSSVQDGNVIVTTRISPEFEGKLKKVVAIITDEPSSDSYETIMARGLGVPCIVETQIATKILRNGEYVTVNGDTGEVFAGASDKGLIEAERVIQKRKSIEAAKVVPVKGQEATKSNSGETKYKTATKIMVYLNDPNLSPSLAEQQVDGVGIFDPKEIIKNFGVHPRLTLEKKKAKGQIMNALTLGLFRVARSFEPRPVIYKISDLSPNNYYSLKGGNELETTEINPILGFRGASRFIVHQDELELELEAVRTIRNKESIRNVWVTIPYVRTLEEFREMKSTISAKGIKRSSTFKLFLLVQIPSTVIRLDQIIDQGLDGVIIDLDMMTQLFLGFDKYNPKIGSNYKDTHPAVLWAIERVIKECNKAKIQSLIYGRAIASSQKLIDNLVNWGVNAIVVDAEGVEQVRKSVYDAEKSLILQRKRNR